MSILNDVLEWKKYRDQEQAASLNAIPTAVQAFITGRQQQVENQNSMLKNQIDAAKAGYRIEGNQLIVDPSMQEQAQRSVYTFNPLTGVIEQSGTIKKGDVVRNTTTTQDIQAKEQAKYGGALETSDRAMKLGDNFNAIPTVKDYQVIKNQVASMDALLANIDTDKESALALDQGLITLFNKITDPTSVVRESEYERTPKNLSLINRFGGAIEKLKKGGAGLTKPDREALVFGAKIIADSRGNEYNQTVNRYKKLAEKSGVDPELVVGGYGEHKPFLGGGNKEVDVRAEYNKLRASGLSQQEAKKRLGL